MLASTACLARTLALHDDPWVEAPRSVARPLAMAACRMELWSGEPGNWSRQCRILEFGEYWLERDPPGRSGRLSFAFLHREL